MKRKGLFIATILMLALSLVLTACGTSKDTTNGAQGGKPEGKKSSGKKEFVSLLTGGTGGTYYPLGGTFTAQWNEEIDGVEATAQVTGASAENLQTLSAGEAEVAFTQTDIASYALDGKMMFEGKTITNFKAMGTLYPETVQIVTTEKSGIKSVEDLKGKTVSIGAGGSGTAANAEQILEVHGLTLEDIEKRDLSFDESTSGIQDGDIDAAFVTAGTPTGAIEGLSATEKVVIVPIAENKIAELEEKYPYYTKDTIPAGTYGSEEEITTVLIKAMLVVRDDLEDDLVYKMTKTLFENTDKIGHSKGKLISAETALEGLTGMELHPGAKKYFDEKGIKSE